MKHIESEYDTRLTTLILCLDDVLSNLALSLNQDPDLLLYKHLYGVSQKMSNPEDTESTLDKIYRVYPALKQLVIGEQQ